MLERVKLIYMDKDMKFPVRQKAINLEGRRRKQGGRGGVGRNREKVCGTNCHADRILRGREI